MEKNNKNKGRDFARPQNTDKKRQGNQIPQRGKVSKETFSKTDKTKTQKKDAPNREFEKKTYGKKSALAKNVSPKENIKKRVVAEEKTVTKSRCPLSDRCGGCQYIDKPYAKQLEDKQRYITKLLSEFGKVEGILGMENPYHYRNKVNAAFSQKRNGEIISGTYEEGTHYVLPTDHCFIEDEKASEIIVTIRGLLKSFRIAIYNEDTGYGLLRHVMVRTARKTGQIMVVMVTASPIFPSKKNFVKALCQAHPEITTIVQNINPRDTSMVLGTRNEVMWGKGYIEDVLCGKTFRISPVSFYQINSLQTEVLYNKAMEFAALTGTETVVDAYCGIGTIGMVASSHAGEVIGVELNKEAVRDAVTNAKLNGCGNITFYNNDAGAFMVGMADQGKAVDVVFMDPPRSGSDEAFLSSVMKLAPKKVVYISCGPESLAWDLKYLTRSGMYRMTRAVAVDMFPMTEHVETVVLLSKLNAKQHIDIELSLDELDLTSAESKATYDEIKAYVKEHSGLNVSSLYISQTKRKYGIIERENYNKPKSENVRQPKCPIEKEKAIVEALRHFKMI